MPPSPALSPLPFLRAILATLFLGLSALLAALPPNGATAQDAPYCA